MIVWLNGTFGAGKTTTAEELTGLLPDSRLFDAEEVGYMLRHVPGLPRVRNFQDWPPWRHLVVETAAQLLGWVGGTLVTVQTLLVERYWTEIRTGLERAGIPVHHYVLHAEHDTLVRRIESGTPQNRQWRLDHLTDYQQALPWLRREAEVIDTTGTSPSDVARLIASAVGGG
jgi:hypothetical protein